MLALSLTSTLLKSQSNSGFTDDEVRKILYIIECKKFLEFDTITYKNEISLLQKKVDLLKSKNEELGSLNKECTTYSQFLYEGSVALTESTASLSKENRELISKLKTSKRAIPIAVSIGFAVGVIIAK